MPVSSLERKEQFCLVWEGNLQRNNLDFTPKEKTRINKGFSRLILFNHILIKLSFFRKRGRKNLYGDSVLRNQAMIKYVH